MAIDWVTVGAIIGIIGALVGIAKYIGYIVDKHRENVDTQMDSVSKEFERVHGRFKDHGIKIQQNTDALKHESERITNTREELKSDYVRHDQLDKTMDNHRTILENVSSRINDMAEDLNQLIGQLRAKDKKDESRSNE